MSDILIKGMEMPKSCYVCAYHHWSNFWQIYVCCAIWVEGDSIIIRGKDVQSTAILRSGRSEKCPLVELPPHGRLIDADDLDNHILGHVDTRYCPTIIPANEVEG